MRAGARALAAATLLGLPVALLAHAFVFGGQHAAGGALSSLVTGSAVFALLLIIALHSRDLVQGSVLAARLRAQTPGVAALIVSSTVWFTLIELSERSHAIHMNAVAAAIVIACWVIRVAVSALARSIAAVAIVLTVTGSHIAALCDSLIFLPCGAPLAIRSFAHTRRLFSRPPPVFS